jgi:hypothetical protein
MSRFALLLCVLAACSKSAGNQDKVSSPPPPATSSQDVIAVPQAGAGPSMGAKPADSPPPAAAKDDDRLRLAPAEGTLAVVAPEDAKPGAETVAKITVSPGKGYHINTEYPIHLTLANTEGVALAKSDFTAGGHDKGKGDADALDEQSLAFAVKLTPSASGSYTVAGKFKFAVCDANQCLPKKETIAIKVAAK